MNTILALIVALQLPAYVHRGDNVESQYHDYAAELQNYDAKLREALTRDAPDLVDRLTQKPSPPMRYGYQILPPIITDGPGNAAGSKPQSRSYSWRRTQSMIEAEIARVAEARDQLVRIVESRAHQKRDYSALVENHPLLLNNQKRIEENIQYNRFWQKAIADDRPRFDRQTAFYDALMEGQPSVSTLASSFAPPAFLKINRAWDGEWIIVVPTYSDITDSEFLSAFKEAVEHVWRVQTLGFHARVEVEFRQITSEAALSTGAHIDVDNHVEHFPPDGAVLTTGSNTTYSIVGKYIALGPEEIPPNVIAHEFGHILGFADGYFRGYRSLADDGFEVLEIIPVPDDIMGAPGQGHVLEDHFRLLLGKALD
jgi:hypothetical protein